MISVCFSSFYTVKMTFVTIAIVASVSCWCCRCFCLDPCSCNKHTCDWMRLWIHKRIIDIDRYSIYQCTSMLYAQYTHIINGYSDMSDEYRLILKQSSRIQSSFGFIHYFSCMNCFRIFFENQLESFFFCSLSSRLTEIANIGIVNLCCSMINW